MLAEPTSYGITDAGPKPWKLMVFEALQHGHCGQQVQAIEALLFEAATMVNDMDVILAINCDGVAPSDPRAMEAGADGHGCLLQMTSMKVADTLRSLLQVDRPPSPARLLMPLSMRPHHPITKPLGQVPKLGVAMRMCCFIRAHITCSGGAITHSLRWVTCSVESSWVGEQRVLAKAMTTSTIHLYQTLADYER